jgi:hypothetical protein
MFDTMKQRMEVENFSGRIIMDNIKQDFYAMMAVTNIMGHFIREANREGSGNLYEYRVNVNHAVGVYKDCLIGVAMVKGRAVRIRLMRELVEEIQRQVVPLREGREVPRKRTSRATRGAGAVGRKG